ncbi:MCE family protein [Umezawaea endophytica]|uniref:MCE family protein n=1 Tax=Umezawaea endophytica TaxID=1654476 RepID=A0A9X3AD94_9PSEU|nr:MCE family protein [Umezawaea endophytica]MCS7475396.1 MCE family protein [Umezawaea endophytica]
MNAFRPALVKLVVFAVVTITLTWVLGATIANFGGGGTSPYTARFTDVVGLNVGDDVRMSGVRVGRVTSIEVADRTLAEVGFDVDERRVLPASVSAVIRYRNLIGQRYVALDVGVGDVGATLPPGGAIPLERTRPALNLTVLFNGFKPLFEALDPEQVNELSHEIIQVLQGEGGTIDSLLAHTASITTALADKDAVIGQVIDNLNSVLGAVNARGPELSGLIVQVQQLATGLAEQRKPIGAAIGALGDLTNTTAGLLTDARPPLKDDIAALGLLSANLGDSGQVIDELLIGLPGNLQAFTRTASYGSWFNFFLCRMSGTVGISSLSVELPIAPLPATRMPERCGP